ncbi:10651_t:CDS:10, partial [Entrophospora sp. SA101]
MSFSPIPNTTSTTTTSSPNTFSSSPNKHFNNPSSNSHRKSILPSSILLQVNEAEEERDEVSIRSGNSRVSCCSYNSTLSSMSGNSENSLLTWETLFIGNESFDKNSNKCSGSRGNGMAIEDLIQRLTIGGQYGTDDDPFMVTFFVFYRKFMRPRDVLSRLMQKFHECEKDIRDNRNTTHEKICNILYHWMTQHPNDLIHPQTRNMLHEFLNIITNCAHLSYYAIILERLVNGGLKTKASNSAKKDSGFGGWIFNGDQEGYLSDMVITDENTSSDAESDQKSSTSRHHRRAASDLSHESRGRKKLSSLSRYVSTKYNNRFNPSKTIERKSRSPLKKVLSTDNDGQISSSMKNLSRSLPRSMTFKNTPAISITPPQTPPTTLILPQIRHHRRAASDLSHESRGRKKLSSLSRYVSTKYNNRFNPSKTIERKSRSPLKKVLSTDNDGQISSSMKNLSRSLPRSMTFKNTPAISITPPQTPPTTLILPQMSFSPIPNTTSTTTTSSPNTFSSSPNKHFNNPSSNSHRKSILPSSILLQVNEAEEERDEVSIRSGNSRVSCCSYNSTLSSMSGNSENSLLTWETLFIGNESFDKNSNKCSG